MSVSSHRERSSANTHHEALVADVGVLYQVVKYALAILFTPVQPTRRPMSMLELCTSRTLTHDWGVVELGRQRAWERKVNVVVGW
eukprot:8704825-Pyramimonas_sp.AAC.1